MKSIYLLLSVLFGVFATYSLIQSSLFTPVLASSFIGLIGSIVFHKNVLLPNYIGISIYCGSFIGMGSVLTPMQLFLASIVATFLILGSNNVLKGFGGKLGLMAYVSSILVGFISIASQEAMAFPTLRTLFQPITDMNSILTICAAVLLGFYSTIYLHHNRGTSAVFASALPSFLIALLIFIYEEAIMALFIATFYSVTFAGMLAEDLLPKRLYPILLIVLILITIFFKNGLGGYGGSLGTIAFLSVFLLSLLKSKKPLSDKDFL